MILLCANSLTIFAQDWQLYLAPKIRQLHDISFQTREKVVVVGGHPFNDSITYMGYSNTSGKNWSLVLDLYPGKIQKAVLFTSEISGISAGVNESLYKTSDGGQTWVADVYAIELNNRNTNTLFKGNGSTVFAAGGLDNENGFILKSNDNGNMWETLYEWTNNEVYAGYYFTSDHIAVCGPNNFIQTSTDNGLTWSTPQIESVEYTPVLNEIVFVDANVGYCAGGKTGVDSLALILRTTDGGLNWNIVYNEINPCLNAIEKVTENILYAAGDYGLILKSEDAGLTWIKQDIDASAGQDIFAIDFFNEHVGGFAGRWGNVLIYNDGYYDNIEHNNIKETNYYPNPATDFVYFEEELSNPTIIDTNGSTIIKISGKVNYISVSELIKGNYFIISDNLKTVKITVQ